MIHSNGKIHNLVKKVKKMKPQSPEQQREVVGFHLLMGCSTSDVEQNAYCKLSERHSLVNDVPKGCLAVYVGEERHRYIIRAHMLNHPIFRALLEKSAKEFGFKHSGGLKLACDTRQFEQLLWLVKKGESTTLNFNKISELVES